MTGRAWFVGWARSSTRRVVRTRSRPSWCDRLNEWPERRRVLPRHETRLSCPAQRDATPARLEREWSHECIFFAHEGIDGAVPPVRTGRDRLHPAMGHGRARIAAVPCVSAARLQLEGLQRADPVAHPRPTELAAWEYSDGLTSERRNRPRVTSAEGVSGERM